MRVLQPGAGFKAQGREFTARCKVYRRLIRNVPADSNEAWPAEDAGLR
ncbi:MAG: hypothetical protein AB1847_10660 [bacterium]